jgi:hypothetical protein
VEVEREIEQGVEECRASEKARMMIGRAELPQPKKGMLLKPTKPSVEPAQEYKTNERNSRMLQLYLDAILILQSSPQNVQNGIGLKIHHQIGQPENTLNALSLNAGLPSCVGP